MNTEENKNKGAFASNALTPGLQVFQLGLTKREYFAGLAMQGLLTNFAKHRHYGNIESFQMVADFAVDQADRLLKTLEETK